jgi:hypothetical protein
MFSKHCTVYISNVIVLQWHAEDTDRWVVMFLKHKDLENRRVNSLLSLVANTKLIRLYNLNLHVF